jgi:UDP-N-acetylglucosamine enolpyruvyl transferase
VYRTAFTRYNYCLDFFGPGIWDRRQCRNAESTLASYVSLIHLQELARLRARIHLDGERATIEGVESLKGAPMMATDLRALVSLVIAALAAEGKTIVNRVYHLDRGFERLEDKLGRCGAAIERLSG